MTEDTYMRSSILLVGIIIALLTGCTQDVENDVSDELITEQSQTEEQQVMEIEHQKASWACNTYIDTDLPELDYADEDKIIFHAYFGLFVYDLNSNEIVSSLNLKELGCQKVQGGCDISVSSDGKNIWIKPKKEEDCYLFSWEKDLLVESEGEEKNIFSDIVSKWDVLRDALGSRIRLCSDDVVKFTDGTYGYLLIEDARITTLTYQSGDHVWRIFTEEACSEPMLLKQDDSYYEAYRICAQESLDDFLYTYGMFYGVGDYAGICVLSKGIEYSDEQQIEWEKQNIRITQMEVEEGKSEEEKKVKCVFQFADSEKILYLHLIRENNNWYVNGLPQ